VCVCVYICVRVCIERERGGGERGSSCEKLSYDHEKII